MSHLRNCDSCWELCLRRLIRLRPFRLTFNECAIRGRVRKNGLRHPCHDIVLFVSNSLCARKVYVGRAFTAERRCFRNRYRETIKARRETVEKL